MNLPKLPNISAFKKKLPTVAFGLLIPLGVLLGFFFSNIKEFVAGGYKTALVPINKMFYVAKVNGVGVPKGEWEKMLKARYGQSAAKDLIDLYMIKGELKKAGIAVSEEEINQELASIEKQLGGQSLETVLQQQGRTLSDFRNDVSLQVGMRKLLGGNIVIADVEIDEYIKTAGDSLPGTTDAEKRDAAKKALTDQKLGEAINTWYSGLQSKVVVENYLVK